MKASAESTRGDHFLLMAAALLLIACFVFGGDSAQASLGTMSAQILAIPVLLAGCTLAIRRGRLRAARWSVAAALLIALVPALQLLPLPPGLWNLTAPRTSLLQDLNAAGVSALDQRWTLSPSASERDFWFLLPGLALFFCMLALGRQAWRRMLALIVFLCVANLVLAFAQMAAGQQSFLNPYPDFAPALAGIFANRNHQADLLAVGLMLVVVFLLDGWKRTREGHRSDAKLAGLGLIVVLLVITLPLVGSRAGVIVAMVMLMGTLLSSGLPTLQSFRRKRTLQFGAILTLVVFLAGLQAALAWMKVDAGVEGSRHALLTETVLIGNAHAPLGSGVGTFIPVFMQGAGEALPLGAYINNAHNEYAQWWLEAGIAGVLAMLLALAALVGALITLLRQRPDSTTRVVGMAAMMGIGVIVLHSTVDYPLRTQAMLAVFAVLAGIAIGAAGNGSTARPLQSERGSARPTPPALMD